MSNRTKHDCKREILSYGKLSDKHLAPATQSGVYRNIKCAFGKDYIQFYKIPSDCTNCVIYLKKGIIKMFINGLSLPDNLFIGYYKVIIDFPELETKYSCNVPEELQETTVELFSGRRNYSSFSRIHNPVFSFTIFKDNKIIIESINVQSNRLRIVTNSNERKQVEIFTDGMAEVGDIVYTDIKTRHILQDNELVNIIINQAKIEIVDESKGLYSYFAEFIPSDECEHKFINASVMFNENIKQYNLAFFEE